MKIAVIALALAVLTGCTGLSDPRYDNTVAALNQIFYTKNFP